MEILGIDFTSSPSRRKSITCLRCDLGDGILHARRLEAWTDYPAFEKALAQPGPWIAGIDFPFGQARRFIETIGWPPVWSEYVAFAGSLGRDGFRSALTDYRSQRAKGDKEHRRATDKAAGSISPQKLYGVPVGLMFFEGAPRLLASPVTIPCLKAGDPERIAVEAYPGVLARTLIGRRSYKNDTGSKQTADQRDARHEILQRLQQNAPKLFGLDVQADSSLCDDPGADHLDALLCAVQAAWAWTQRDNGYGAPPNVDCLEGWIAGIPERQDPSSDPASRGHLLPQAGEGDARADMSPPIARGEAIPPRFYGPHAAADLAAYAAASGDDNPLHLDPSVAAKAGLARPPIHGMLIMATIEPYLRGWRPEATVTKIAAKFVKPVLAGETFEVAGKVVQITPGAAVLRIMVRRGTDLVCLAEAFVTT